MGDRKFGQVEDYTNAFLGVFYMLLVMSLVMIWGLWGYLAALCVCGAMHYGIKHFTNYRDRVEADWDARVKAAVARGRG